MLWVVCGAVAHAADAASPIAAEAASEARTDETPPSRRKKPGYHIGGFRIRPSLTLDAQYDDNVFTTRSDTESDWIVKISPQVRIDSTWEAHSLRFRAGVDAGIYDRWNDENYIDRWSKVDGRFDVNAQLQLFAGLGYEFAHEGRDSPDSEAGAIEPTTFRSVNANIGTRFQYSDNRFQVGITYEKLDFDNVPTRTGVIINADRDRTLLGLGLRASKQISDDTEVFAQTVLDTRDYDRAVDQFGTRRDSDGYRVAAGLRHSLSDGNEVEAFLGVLRRDYDDPRFTDVTKPDLGGRIRWTPGSNSKLTFEVQRSVNETTEIGSAGYLKTAFSASVERRRSGRLMPYLNAGYSVSDFLAADREDEDYSVGIGLKYYVTRNSFVSVGASHVRRDSNDAGAPVYSNDFKKNTVFVNFTAQLYPLN